MNILVVHDRPEILDELRTLVLETLGADATTDIAEDFHSARACLEETIYDLLIIDLTIPFIKGISPPDFNAVDQLLRELFTIGTLNIPGDIIGVTRDPDALELVNTSIGPHLMVMIPEDTEGLWKGYLRDKINYAYRAAETRSISVNRHHNYDVLVVTAMDQEMRPYESRFEIGPIKQFQGAKEFLFKDKRDIVRKGIAYSIGRSGQPSAASMSQALISTFRPKLALMSGYCGGVEAKVALGDLIFFEAAYAWDYGKWTEEVEDGGVKRSVFLPRPNPIDIFDQDTFLVAREMILSDFGKSPDFRRKIEKLSKGKVHSFKLHRSPVGSGSAVVANDEIIARIRGLNESIWAVDMECYGFYHAAKNTNVVRPQFICIKSVSDFCNGEKGDDLHDVCSAISAECVVDIILHRWDFDTFHERLPLQKPTHLKNEHQDRTEATNL